MSGIGGELLPEGPAADGRAIEPERMPAMHFRSGEAVGSGRVGTQQLAQQSEDQRRPLGKTVAAGTPRLPVALSALSAGAQIVGIEAIETAATQSQFSGRGACGQSLPAEACQDITNEGSGMAAVQLLVVFSSGEGRGEGARAHFLLSLRSAPAQQKMRCPALLARCPALLAPRHGRMF